RVCPAGAAAAGAVAAGPIAAGLAEVPAPVDERHGYPPRVDVVVVVPAQERCVVGRGAAAVGPVHAGVVDLGALGWLVTSGPDAMTVTGDDCFPSGSRECSLCTAD